MTDLCPECQCPISSYHVEDWTEKICWNCGYYKSDSPAFKECPEIFVDMVRKNPSLFMKKFLGWKSSDGSYHDKQSDDKLPKPPSAILINT